MFYFEETLNLEPAAPSTMDALVEFAEADLIPACKAHGIRMLAAWYSHAEWYAQVRHLYEFPDLAAFSVFWDGLRNDARWLKLEQIKDEFAPQRSFNLLEDLGPIPRSVTESAVVDSAVNPLGVYGLAILHVLPGKMQAIKAGLAQSVGTIPIVASWQPVTGNRNVFIDVWKGPIAQDHYKPADEASRVFFEPLRQMAPREKIINVYTLPYSALR